MKQIQLSKQGKLKNLNLVALVDDSDFDYLNQWRWQASYCKFTNSYYAIRGIYLNAKKIGCISMQREVLGIMDKKLMADHINHDTLDNQRSNLRIATSAQNQANSRPRQNSSSIYLGVSLYKRDKKWRADIRKNGKSKFIGLFLNEQDAAVAYDKEAIQMHGNFANLNFKVS